MSEACFIGIDLGTQGLRVVVLDTLGTILASAEQPFPLTENLRQEQDPLQRWADAQLCLKDAIGQLSTAQRSSVKAIAVDSTSGTVIPIDKNALPIHHAIMYSDQRSAPQATAVTAVAKHALNEGFTAFSSSTGLAKMVWFTETFPEKRKDIHRWIHAADFITGQLSGEWNVTDYTNVLKSGYDLTKLEWPAYLSAQLGIDNNWLQQVLPSGTAIGTIRKSIAEELKLPYSVVVTTGITDGCASQIASGAMQPGQWNTTIGTTLVIKGVTNKPVIDQSGSIYNHRHPAGFWMPGGAGNIGADWVSKEFKNDFARLNSVARALTPTGLITYPLVQKGERFPFVAPDANGFSVENVSREMIYTANMEAVAFAEHYAYGMIERLSGETVDAVYTAGGASNSPVWLQIRSNIMQKPVYKMKHISGAVGAAILAASSTWFSDISEATSQLTQQDELVEPQPEKKQAYSDQYGLFLEAMKSKGFIN